MKELKTPTVDNSKFRANGKTYSVETKISIGRKIICDQLIIEITGGGTMGEHYNDWRRVYDLCNDKKFADIAVLAYNRMEGVKKWNERHDPVLSLCALYVNETNEDRRTLTPEQIKTKIEDWEKEGIEYAFFLELAKSLMRGLIVSWQDISPSTSEKKP